MASDHSWPGNAWPVKGKLLGKEVRDRDPKKSRDVSGIASTWFDDSRRLCLVIDDEAQAAQVVVVEEGLLTAGAAIRLIDDEDEEGGLLELDGEGVAFQREHFYVVGSHGHPRDKRGELDPIRDAETIRRRIAASSRLVRIALSGKDIERYRKQKRIFTSVATTGRLREALAGEPQLAPFLSRRLEKNGLTIEGLEVHGRRLYVGLRAPSLGDEAAVLSVDAEAIFTVALDLAPKLHLLRLGPGRGVRDLAACPNGVLVLAGPANEDPGPYSIYHWDFDTALAPVGEIPDTVVNGERLKPEAVLYLDGDRSRARVLIFFDGGEEGAPRPFDISIP